MDIDGFHPNIKDKRIKSDKRALEYVSKECPEDQLIQFNMDIKQETQARAGHRKLLGKRLIEGEPLKEIVLQDNYDMLFSYQSIQKNLEAFMRDVERGDLTDKP